MSLHHITDIETLRDHVYAAMQLEHATIPPYLTAFYSIKPGTNTEAAHIIRTVAVEEMLHLTLVGNLMNAIGGRPDLTAKGFMPAYPAYLPDGETDFQVGLQRFSPEAIETFLKIERPASLAGAAHTVTRDPHPKGLRAGRTGQDSEEHFFSIGEFYKAIEAGLKHLHATMGDALFCGDPARQITPEYYYSGGGELIAVTDLDSALAALDLIAEQGEGTTDHIFDEDGEIAHYYRFHQLVAGKYYVEGDAPGHPTGGAVDVDWDAVYPIMPNARLADLPEGAPVAALVKGFNRDYAAFLGLLTRAFDGEPGLFIDAVGDMFRLKEGFGQIMKTPLGEGSGLHAAPSFEVDAVADLETMKGAA
ncbi:MAG: ferritin-like domain-containing protein [Roseicyclus sp.]